MIIDESVNHRISECSNQVQKEYKTRHNWVEGYPLEIMQELKSAHTSKWSTQKPESVLENEMHKVLWDF